MSHLQPQHSLTQMLIVAMHAGDLLLSVTASVSYVLNFSVVDEFN